MGLGKFPNKLSFNSFDKFVANKGYIKILRDAYTKCDNDGEIKIFWDQLKVSHFIVTSQVHLGVYLPRRKAQPTAEHIMQWMKLKICNEWDMCRETSSWTVESGAGGSCVERTV